MEGSSSVADNIRQAKAERCEQKRPEAKAAGRPDPNVDGLFPHRDKKVEMKRAKSLLGAKPCLLILFAVGDYKIEHPEQGRGTVLR